MHHLGQTCCPINSLSFMPAFWVHREMVGEYPIKRRA